MQEGENIQEFWQEIEQEVVSGIEDGCLLILQMDANAKLGREIIKNDPHDISENGKLLLDILERQNLTVVNSLDVCDGTITRERKTKSRIEKSVIDYVIVCSKMKEFVKSMKIDEDRFHVLTKYASKKGLRQHKVSDHNILVCRFSIQVEIMMRTVRKEFFKLKNIEDQEKLYH